MGRDETVGEDDRAENSFGLRIGGRKEDIMASTPTLEVTPSVLSTPDPVTSVSISTVSSKLKFLLVSTHCQQYTGYSKVSWGILKELSKNPWLSVTHFGF